MNTRKSIKLFTYIIGVTLFSFSSLWAQENILWTHNTNERVYSSPCISGDILYYGSGDSTFYALNKLTGKKLWDYKTDGPVHSSPTVALNMVYFASADGFLYALNKADGQLKWKMASEGEKMYGLWDYYLSSPTVDDDMLFWGSGDGNIYAVDAGDGSILWKYSTGDIIHATPKVYEDKVLVGSYDGYFYALDRMSGEEKWKFKTVGATYFPKGEIQRGALVKDGVVYFGSRDYNIYAIDVNTGRGHWNMKQPSGWIIATPLEYKEGIYFGTSDDHSFYCLNKVSGEVKWRKSIAMRAYGTAVSSNDIIYFGTFDGKVLGVDYQTGETIWRFQTVASKENYHTIFRADGHFREDFELYGNNYLESEAKIHSLGSILSSPAIDDGVIYFGSSDGKLYAVSLSDE